jgi:hypothetical protein
VRKVIVYIVFLVLMLVLPYSVPAPALASAPLVDSGTLVEHPDSYNGKRITFKGEAIGDVMERADGAWININDDAYSRQGRTRRLAGYNSGQSVLVSNKSEARTIKRLGDYDNRGDIVEVSGIFQKADPDHGGDMMIAADSLRIVKPGFSLPHPISTRKISLAITWLAISAVMVAAWRWRARVVRH